MLQRFQVPELSDSESESASPVNKRMRVRSSSSSSSSSGDGKVTELSKPSGLMLSQLVTMNEGNTAADDSAYGLCQEGSAIRSNQRSAEGTMLCQTMQKGFALETSFEDGDVFLGASQMQPRLFPVVHAAMS